MRTSGRTICRLALGVVEAACKPLASQRLKHSGMRWRTPGGQAILTFRALCQSERFERAWPLLGETYKQSATLPRKVIALNEHREKASRQYESYTQLELAACVEPTCSSAGSTVSSVP